MHRNCALYSDPTMGPFAEALVTWKVEEIEEEMEEEVLMLLQDLGPAAVDSATQEWGEGRMGEELEGKEEDEEEEEEDQGGGTMWHEIIAKPFVDPSTGHPALLLMQYDVTDR